MDLKAQYPEFFKELSEKYVDEGLYVSSVGNKDSDVVLIGEAPGANEVEQGEPFVGRAGKKMDKILDEIGVKRSDLYITNLVKVRPPENRNPRKDEIEAWKPLLEKELEDVDPEVIITLGNFPSKTILNTSKGISQIHGDLFAVNGRKVMPVYHPAATLYDQSKTPDLKEDLKKAFGKENNGQKTLDEL